MGNCVCKGSGGSRKLYDKDDLLIRVVTPNGGVMELHPPIFADFITNEFPGHVIHDTLSIRHSSPPLLHGEELFPGNIYYLLPFSSSTASTVQQHYTELATPYRMSFGKTPVKAAASGGGGGSSGVWKVRLVISPEQLAEILAEDVETEAFVESVRTVAKCGGQGGGANWRANSDQLSITSSFKGQLR
ncbi:hypothetical protein Bca4012_095878 [Brassica carinata]|uniref:Uncharacterized protein n=6 Tax=Brassica TaxID=3705 RepID=A0A8S9RH12_BRACR|nr:PREDICTED: uncharacterized protein LOC106310377 [Brassica oleracea var. oleracea]XP_022563218.1 uncharacterized protein LOC106414045 [Brassica napus]KAF2616903.1 hypothetical protein F2Q68_00041916 [Brassica cretica]KAG2258860.1 hypothetical protein Bca52824_078154 [Brassica carinata]VDD58035.1 unnamed protein product [Brassica oleracea]KAF3498284.1 hypothetical protein DY000_02056854 [Brassica cretica]KAF3571772.1 hypothetical protein F2Q69_00062422 [Brassica cretica]